jgi:hypothetical protein
VQTKITRKEAAAACFVSKSTWERKERYWRENNSYPLDYPGLENRVHFLQWASRQNMEEIFQTAAKSVNATPWNPQDMETRGLGSNPAEEDALIGSIDQKTPQKT